MSLLLEKKGTIPVETWVIRAGVALLFVFVGQSKFSNRSQWVAIFNQIGFGQWFRYFTGVLQITGGLLTLTPRTFVYGILTLASTMAGAMAAWIVFLGSPVTAIIPGFLLLGLFFVGGEELIEFPSRLKRLIPVLVALAISAHPSGAQPQAERALKFEVASIKVSNIRGPQGVQVQYLPGGRLSAKGAPIPILIGEAYGIDWRGRVALTPEFTKSHPEPREQYDIEAVAPLESIAAGTTAATQKEILRSMLQSLLSDRFRLVLRRETQEMPVFAIVIAKDGHNLKPATMKAADCVGKANLSGDGVSCHSFQAGSGPDIG